MSYKTSSLFIILVSLVLSNIDSTVSGQTCASVTVNANVVDGQCSAGVTKFPVVTLGDVGKYSDIKLSPSVPIVWSDAAGAHFNPKESGAYTLKVAGSDACVATYKYDVKAPSLKLTQPACPYTFGSVDAFGMSPCTSYIVDSVDNVALPAKVFSGDSSAHTFQCGAACSVPFFNPPKSSFMPKIEIVDAMCNTNTGSIVVQDAGTFSSIVLTLGSKTIDQSNLKGKYVDLAAGQYTIDITSVTCGLQSIPVTVGKKNPTITVDHVNRCPNDFKVNLGLVGFTDASPKFKINGASSVVASPVVIPQTGAPVEIVYDGQGCSSRVQVEIPSYISEITWSHESSNFCNKEKSTLVTLAYPTDIHKNVVVKSGSKLVTLDKSGTKFNATFDNVYTVTSDCDTDGFEIIVSHPKPIIIESPLAPSTSRSCFYNTTLTVPNHLVFSSIVLESPKGLKFTADKNGQFVNIPRLDYTMTYVYAPESDCSETSLQMQVNLQTQELLSTDVKIVFDGYLNNITPDCGVSSVSANFKITGQFGEIKSTLNNYVPGKPTDIVVSNAMCSSTVRFTPEDAVGGITVTGQNFDTMYVNGVNTPFDPKDNFLSLPTGSYDLKFTKPNPFGPVCSYQQTVVVGQVYPEFGLKYTITPVSDCNNGGSIQIDNFDKYVYLSVERDVQTTGKFTGVLSGINTITFTSQSPPCAGSIKVFVPPPKDTYLVTPYLLNSPTCGSDTIYGFNLTNPDLSTVYGIDAIKINNKGPEKTASYARLPVGDNVVSVRTKKCLIDATVKVAAPTTDPIQAQVVTSPSCAKPVSPFISIQSSSEKVNINSIVATSGLQSGNNIYNPSYGKQSVTVNWNDVCTKSFNVEVTKPSATVVPEYEFVQPTCGNFDSKLVIKNAKLFSQLSLNNIAFDSEGSIVIPPVQSATLYYIEITSGCPGQLEIVMDRALNVALPSAFSYTNETCHGSYNGLASLAGTFPLTVIDHTSATTSLVSSGRHYPTSSAQSFDLGAGEYTIVASQPSRPFCSVIQPFRIGSLEPQVVITPGVNCTTGDSQSLNIDFGLHTTQFQALINGTIYDNSTVIPQFKQGVYNVQVNITDPRCRRQLLPVSSTFSITKCEEDNEKKKKKSIAWIAAPIIVGVAIIAVAGYYFVRRGKNKNSPIKMRSLSQ
eukprot:gene18868-22569_t